MKRLVFCSALFAVIALACNFGALQPSEDSPLIVEVP